MEEKKSFMDWFLGKKTKKTTKANLPLKTKIRYELRKEKWKPVAASIVTALILIVLGTIFFRTNLALLVIVVFFGTSMPIAIYIYLKQRRLESIEEQFPNFLRDIAEFKRSGLPLNRAIQNTTKNDYGQLTSEVKRMALELSWGVSFQKTLEKFSERTNSHIIERAVSIIVVAQSSGGEVTEVLDTVSADLRKLKEIEKERKSKLSVYTLTIYAVYLLLLFIIIMLMGSFVPSIPKIQAAGKFMGGGLEETITEFEFRTLLFHVSLIEAFFAGLISGDMGEGKITAGIKHAIILVLITMLAFQLVPPSPATYKIADSILDIPPSQGTPTEGIESITHLTDTFDNKEIARLVGEKAKERGLARHKGITSADISFNALSGECIPCAEGKIVVLPNKVTVHEQVPIKYKVRYSGTQYQIMFRTA
ncbi:type II secretion system F family protein [archaeon]|nr:type II secretion system F family protein [archaeon]